MKVISGGQSGADQGGLEGARDAGVETGGTAPAGWWTEFGPRPGFLRDFGLVEGPPDPKRYPKRTELNVRQSDATALFGNGNSPGTRLTERYCAQYGKPVLANPGAAQLAGFIRQFGVKTLNVAGNRESKHPGLQANVRAVVFYALKFLEEQEKR